MYNIESFRPLLDMITVDHIKEWIEVCLSKAPDYFWKVPASITGKHHPLWALGIGGLVRHTLNAVCAGINMGRYDSELETKIPMIIIPALIGHDLCKYGIRSEPESDVTDPNRYYYNNHHIISASFCREMWYAHMAHDINPEYYEYEAIVNQVCECIRTHTGRWGIRPTTKEGWLVHFADLAVSTRIPEAITEKIVGGMDDGNT